MNARIGLGVVVVLPAGRHPPSAYKNFRQARDQIIAGLEPNLVLQPAK